MRTRILPPEEWPRLAGTEAESVWPHVKPDTARVLVVEDDGQIVATLMLLTVLHAECLWVKSSHRRSAGFALMRGMRSEAADLGASHVVGASRTPAVSKLIRHVGGKPIPAEFFVVPMEEACQQP